MLAPPHLRDCGVRNVSRFCSTGASRWCSRCGRCADRGRRFGPGGGVQDPIRSNLQLGLFGGGRPGGGSSKTVYLTKSTTHALKLASKAMPNAAFLPDWVLKIGTCKSGLGVFCEALQRPLNPSKMPILRILDFPFSALKAQSPVSISAEKVQLLGVL